MSRFVVVEAQCPCAVTQPTPAAYAAWAVWVCETCHQSWQLRTRQSSNRQGGGVLVGGLMVGGMLRGADVRYWSRLGRNVARDAAMARARAADEAAYVRDAAELRRAVAAGQVSAGTNVRAYRAHREAVAVARVHAVRRSPGSMAYAAGLALLVIVGVMRKGTRQSLMAARIERHVNESTVRERETERRKAWLSPSQRP